MLKEFKNLLNNLCEEFGTNNEVVLKVSQHVDKLIVSEQRNRLIEIKELNQLLNKLNLSINICEKYGVDNEVANEVAYRASQHVNKLIDWQRKLLIEIKESNE